MTWSLSSRMTSLLQWECLADGIDQGVHDLVETTDVGMPGDLARLVGIDVQRLDPGRPRPVDVEVHGVAHVEAPLRRHADGIESEVEDGRVGLLDTDDGGIDHHRHPRAGVAV